MDKLTKRLELLKKMIRSTNSSNFIELNNELEYDKLCRLYNGNSRYDNEYARKAHKELIELKCSIANKTKDLLLNKNNEELKKEMIAEIRNSLKIWNEDDCELILHKFYKLIERNENKWMIKK